MGKLILILAALLSFTGCFQDWAENTPEQAERFGDLLRYTEGPISCYTTISDRVLSCVVDPRRQK